MAVQEKILGFEISIDHIIAVKVLKSKGDFGSIKLGYRIGEALIPGKRMRWGEEMGRAWAM